MFALESGEIVLVRVFRAVTGSSKPSVLNRKSAKCQLVSFPVTSDKLLGIFAQNLIRKGKLFLVILLIS